MDLGMETIQIIQIVHELLYITEIREELIC